MSSLKDRLDGALRAAKKVPPEPRTPPIELRKPPELGSFSTVGRSVPRMQMLVQDQLDESRRRAELAEAQLGKPMELDPRDLVVVSERKRKLSSEQRQQLKALIQSEGVIEPIRVRPIQGGRFEVVSGSNRTEVSIELGMDKVPVSLIEAPDEKVERTAFFANLFHAPLPDYEKFLGLKREIDQSGISQSALSEATGIPRTSLIRLMAFAKLPAEIALSVSERPNDFSGKCVETILSAIEKGVKPISLTSAIAEVDGEVLPKHIESLIKAQRPPLSRPAASYRVFRGTRGATLKVTVSSSAIRVESTSSEDLKAVNEALQIVLSRKYSEVG